MNIFESFPFKSGWERLVSATQNMPHALLLHGPEGIGKTWLAARLSMRLLCETEKAALDPCGRCDACKWVLAGTHPDLRWVEPDAVAIASGRYDDSESAESPRASRAAKPSQEIRIEQVRALAGFLNVGSHRGARRVAIVQPAETLNANSANALLKSLEEPPGSATFILVSHEPARLLPTIRSRCLSIGFEAPPAREASAWLAAQGAPDAEKWLRFWGGAPFKAAETGEGANGKRIRGLLDALEHADWQALEEGMDREGMELLVATTQKFALDRALEAAGGETRFGTRFKPGRGGSGTSAGWLELARKLGPLRALARHPLNPALFSKDVTSMIRHASKS